MMLDSGDGVKAGVVVIVVVIVYDNHGGVVGGGVGWWQRWLWMMLKLRL